MMFRKPCILNLAICFHMVSKGTSVVDLTLKMFHNDNVNASTQLQCVNCQFTEDLMENKLSSVIFNASEGVRSTKDQLRQTMVHESHVSCSECLMPLRNVTVYDNVPNILLFSVDEQNISITKHIKIKTASGSKKCHLNGIVYHGAFHFTFGIVTSNSFVWFYHRQLDANYQYENNLNDFDELELCSCGTRQVSLVVSTKD
jgi:hypothetical protein